MVTSLIGKMMQVYYAPWDDLITCEVHWNVLLGLKKVGEG
jgi:hypothetical protein